MHIRNATVRNYLVGERRCEDDGAPEGLRGAELAANQVDWDQSDEEDHNDDQ